MFDKTVSWRKVKRPCSRAVLHAPRIWAVVHMLFPQRTQNFSVDICHRCKFDGDGNVS